MDDFRAAEDYVAKIEYLREKVFQLVDTDPKLLALKALIARDRPDKDNRTAVRDARRWTNSAATELRAMERSKNSKPEAMAYFVLAKFHAGREPEHKRALQYFKLARDHDPECICSAAGLGALQIESEVEGVQNADDGVKLLQSVWDQCETKSWRLALRLIDAYETAGDAEKAGEMIDFALASDAVSAEKKVELESGGYRNRKP